jgi:hypothetical protein
VNLRSKIVSGSLRPSVETDSSDPDVFGGVAQRLEQRLHKPRVAGSIPAAASSLNHSHLLQTGPIPLQIKGMRPVCISGLATRHRPGHSRIPLLNPIRGASWAQAGASSAIGPGCPHHLGLGARAPGKEGRKAFDGSLQIVELRPAVRFMVSFGSECRARCMACLGLAPVRSSKAT